MDKNKEKKMWFLIILITLGAAGGLAAWFNTKSALYKGASYGSLGPTEPTKTVITIASDKDSLASGDIVAGTIDAVVAAFKLMNETDAPVTIASIKMKKTGETADDPNELNRNKLSNFRFYKGQTAIGEQISQLNSDDTITLSTPITLPQGNSSIIVKATLSSTAAPNKVFRFDVDAGYIVAADVTIQASGESFPVRSALLRVAPPPKPDLFIQNTIATAGTATVSIGSVIGNQGTASLTAPAAATLTIDEIAVTPTKTITAPFPTGATRMITWFNIPVTAGMHTAKICADTGNSIIESDESNNCTVPQKEFTIASPPGIPEATAGTSTIGTTTSGATAMETGAQLTIQTSPDSPTTIVPLTANWFTAAKLQFSATGRIELEQLSIRLKEGVGNALPYDEIDKIQLFESTGNGIENQISSQQSLDTDGTAEFELNPWIIEAPALARTLIIKAKLKTTSTNAGKHFALGIASDSDITTVSNTPIENTDFPVMGVERAIEETGATTATTGTSTTTITSSTSNTATTAITASTAPAATSSPTTTITTAGPSGTPNLNINSTPSFSPNNPKKGDTINFSVNVKNIGTWQAASTTTRLYIDTDGSYLVENPSTWEIQYSQATQALDPNNETTVTLQWTSATEGTRSFMICTDATTVVSESNENNNCSVIQTLNVTASAKASSQSVNTQSQRTTNQTQAINTSQPQQTGNAALDDNQLRSVAFEQEGTGLEGSVRLRRAPERGNTGPETLLYFGVLAAIQGGLLIRKKFKK